MTLAAFRKKKFWLGSFPIALLLVHCPILSAQPGLFFGFDERHRIHYGRLTQLCFQKIGGPVDENPCLLLCFSRQSLA